MTVPAVAGARGEPRGGSPRTSMVSPGSWARPDVAARSADGSRHHATRRDGGTELPSFARRGASAVAPPGRAPGSRVRSAPALHAVPPSPRGWREWLLGTGCPATVAGPRRHSTGFPRSPLSGAPRRRDYDVVRRLPCLRIAVKPQRPQRRIPLNGKPRPQPLDKGPHPLDAPDLLDTRERPLVPPFHDQLRPPLPDAGQQAQLRLGRAVHVEDPGHRRLGALLLRLRRLSGRRSASVRRSARKRRRLGRGAEERGQQGKRHGALPLDRFLSEDALLPLGLAGAVVLADLDLAAQGQRVEVDVHRAVVVLEGGPHAAPDAPSVPLHDVESRPRPAPGALRAASVRLLLVLHVPSTAPGPARPRNARAGGVPVVLASELASEGLGIGPPESDPVPLPVEKIIIFLFQVSAACPGPGGAGPRCRSSRTAPRTWRRCPVARARAASCAWGC